MSLLKPPVEGNQGGTGQVSYTIGDLLYANTTTTLTKLGIGSNTNVLSVVGGIPAWITASSGGITTINGDSGSVTGSTVTLFANLAGNNCGSTVSFVNSSTTSTLNVSSSQQTFIGSSAGNASAGTGSTGFGHFAGNSCNGGQQNLWVGNFAGYQATSGNYNCGIGGGGALQSLIGGSANTACGGSCLSNIVSGSYNTSIGFQSGNSQTSADSSNININSLGSAGVSNSLRIGAGTGTGAQQLNSAFISGIQGITVTGTAVLISSGDQLGIAISSKRYKENIEPMGSYSSQIMKLKPSIFNYIVGEDHSLQSGLIAEEVYEIMPSLVVLDKEGFPQTVKYHDLPALLLNEIQKLNKRISDLENH